MKSAVALVLLLLPTRGAEGGPLGPPHFPDRLHAFVWRNWTLVPVDRIAKVAGATAQEIQDLGLSMGLPPAVAIPENAWKRSYITVIRRNWHLLPYEQLTELLGWTREQLEFTLREDDFLYIKLGSRKPPCEPIRYAAPGAGARARAREIAAILRQELPEGALADQDAPFSFVGRLSQPPAPLDRPKSAFSPRFCYSYFALYGDPLLDPECDPYPDGYLERLAVSGVDGVWLQGVLSKLAPFPWDPGQSERYQERRRSLKELVARARRHGIGVHLYLNEPRAMPTAWYSSRPELRGVTEGGYAALCTSHPDVKKYLADSIESLLRDVPDLAGLFTITASENLTSCASHGRASACPSCAKRPYAEIIAEVNALFQEGIRKSGAATRLVAWDWGWDDAHAQEILERLPAGISFMSVSEWKVPIERGGVKGAVGEYSISAIGPGPRALRHFEVSRKRGMKTIAKIQAGNTWELSAVPYIPAVENVALHAANLRRAGVDGLMLGWTLGGCPSPNLEVVAEMGRDPAPTADQAMERVARRHWGEALAPAVVRAWRAFSAAFREFPFDIRTVYQAPLQLGPSNLLWEAPTGMHATMIGFPYDDLDGWRADYPVETFAAQLEKVADGFDRAAETLADAALSEERALGQACAIHFRSVANQARFVSARRALAPGRSPDEAKAAVLVLERTLKEELVLARRLAALQSADSRIGFEASNQYYYRPIDLAEKILNCRDLLDRWLPQVRR